MMYQFNAIVDIRCFEDNNKTSGFMKVEEVTFFLTEQVFATGKGLCSVEFKCYKYLHFCICISRQFAKLLLEYKYIHEQPVKSIL